MPEKKKNRIAIKLIRINPVHSRFSIWVNGGRINSAPGSICLRNEEVEDFFSRLNPERVENQHGEYVNMSQIIAQITKRRYRGMWVMSDEKAIKLLRTRFRRWLGQKTRGDRHTWTELIDSNYQGWRGRIIRDHNLALKASFKECIDVATLEELQRLDILILDDMLDNKEGG